MASGDESEWNSPANLAVEMNMISSGSNGAVQRTETFHPMFTYPIFGDEEEIFGYKDLHIKLSFAAHNAVPNLEIQYGEKFKAVGDVKPVDIKDKLKDFLPAAAFADTKSYLDTIQNDATAKEWKPPGTLVKEYQSDGKQFEIYAGSLSDPAVKEIVDNIQILVTFYIEGGVPLITDDVEWTTDRWTVFFVYEKLSKPTAPTSSIYSFAGYCTTYRWWTWDRSLALNKEAKFASSPPFPPSTVPVLDLPSRLRISQFLILPTHRSQGHGTFLYETIRNYTLADPRIHELTVEDPNETFDVLRDTNDWFWLRKRFIEAGLNLTAVSQPDKKHGAFFLPRTSLFNTNTLTTLHRTSKIAPRQFSRVFEMYLLSTIPAQHRAPISNSISLLTKKYRVQNEDDRKYYWWRSLVKARVYKQHRTVLMQIEPFERVEKLEEVLRSVEEEYLQLLGLFEEREQNGWGEEAGSSAGPVRKRKRNVWEDDEDEDDDDDEEEGGEGEGEEEDDADDGGDESMHGSATEDGDDEDPLRARAKRQKT